MLSQRYSSATLKEERLPAVSIGKELAFQLVHLRTAEAWMGIWTVLQASTCPLEALTRVGNGQRRAITLAVQISFHLGIWSLNAVPLS